MREHVDLEVGFVFKSAAALLAGDSGDGGVIGLASAAVAPHARLGRDVGRGVDLAVMLIQRRLRLQRHSANETVGHFGC